MIRRRMPIYDPASDPDLFYWFDASDTDTLKGSGGTPIANGAQVYEWLNKKGSQKFVQSGTVTRPTWRTDGPGNRAGLRFTPNSTLGLDDRAGLESLEGMTVLVVATVDPYSHNNHQAILNIHTNTVITGSRTYLGFYQQRLRLGGRRIEGDSAAGFVTTGSVTHSKPTLAAITIDYLSTAERFYQDGILTGNGAVPSAGNSTSALPLSITVGSSNANSDWLTGWVHSVMLFRKRLTPQELVGPHHYLRTKWGIEPTSSGGMGLMMDLFSEPPPPEIGEIDDFGEGESESDVELFGLKKG